jgi:predicted TIM-barrel fold metal-dependent hydrolase
MANPEDFEIIDAQIHAPAPLKPLASDLAPDIAEAINVELAREAMDSVGVDIALAVASEAFIASAVTRYPDRFKGVVTFDHSSADLEADAARVKRLPGVVAGRALITNYLDAVLRQEFRDGKFEPLFRAAAREKLPLFISTHGWAAEMDAVAARYPELTLIIDHIGVSQTPYSPPREKPWDKLPDLLALARYPNVHVKLCGAPLMSTGSYPYDDVWPWLDEVFAAFGADRIMWASDYTRLREAELPRGNKTRRRGMLYSDCLNFLLDSSRLSPADKRKIFGATARRVLNWPT